MEMYGVLVVDDSPLMRKMISAIIDSFPNFYCIGKARNGIDAIEKIKRLKPDIVTLDIEMPELDGLQTLKMLMKDMPIPVMMLSNGTDFILEAIELGAVDFVIKHELIKGTNEIQIDDFYHRLNVAVTAKLPKPLHVEPKTEVPMEVEEKPTYKKNSNKELLIIGSSTGGPSALQKILTKIPPTFPVPIVVIQHMPPGFTKPLADRFNGLCNLTVKEAEHNEILAAGTIYIAPAGIQTTLKKSEDGNFIVRQKITTLVDTLYKPSIDVTLLSIAEQVKDTLLTVILTGMGDDGLRGCQSVKKFGGTLVAESEETCVVYGMPKVVFEAGLVDKQLPLPHIFNEIMRII